MTTPRTAIGIDIGGTKIAIALVDRQGAILARETMPTEAELGFDRGVSRMIETSRRLLKQAGASPEGFMGVGVGCAGPVYPEQGIINNPYTLPTWEHCDVVRPLRAAFDRPAYLENDADAAALGECFAGAARGANRVVMVTLGTGVGGGVVIDGAVYRGAAGEHPELGHIPIDPRGPACYCGTNGCLESIASGTAIAAAAAVHGMADSRELFSEAAAGNAAALAILGDVKQALAFAAWTILHTFMPELIVLGGGLAEAHYELLAAPLEDAIPRATMVPAGKVRVAPAQLGNDAGVIGAAGLALRTASA